MNTVQIILALRERLKASGYVVHLGVNIDPQQDQIPCVSVQIAAGGIQTVNEKPLLKKTLAVMIEYVFETKTKDPLLEVLEASDKLNRDLYRPERCKGMVDQLDGNAFSVQIQKTIPVIYPERTDLGLVQTILTISYVEK